MSQLGIPAFHVKHSAGRSGLLLVLWALPRAETAGWTVGSIIAVTNQKGGVGKTTTAINLSASLAASERRVLLIDGDPQGNASSGIGLTTERVQATLYDVLIDGREAQEAIHHGVHFPSLDVLAATPDLAGAEVELVGEVGRELVLRRAIDRIRDSYDFIVVDCPPSLGLLTVNMLSAADSLIIPLQCEYFALEGLTQLLRTVGLVQQRLNSGLHVFGVLLTMYDARLNLSRQVADDAREYFGNLVFNTVIPRNIRLAEAPSFGRPIVTYDIASVGSSAYLALAKEVIERSGTSVSSTHSHEPDQPDQPDQPAAYRPSEDRPSPDLAEPLRADREPTRPAVTDEPGSPGEPVDSIQPVPQADGQQAGDWSLPRDCYPNSSNAHEPGAADPEGPWAAERQTDVIVEREAERAFAPPILQPPERSTDELASDASRRSADVPVTVTSDQGVELGAGSEDEAPEQPTTKLDDRSNAHFGDNPPVTTTP